MCTIELDPDCTSASHGAEVDLCESAEAIQQAIQWSLGSSHERYV